MAGGRRTRGRGRVVDVAVGLVVTLVLAGCASSTTAGTGAPSGDPATTAGTTSGTDVGQASARWVAADLPVHTQLSATDDSIVYAGVVGEELVVTALDPTTGAERWRRRSVVSDRIPGVEQRIQHDDDTAYFLTDDDELALTAVATASGDERWSTALPSDTDASIRGCGTDVCSFVDVPGGRERWRFDVATGEVIDRADASAPGAEEGAIVLAERPGSGVSLSAAGSPLAISQRSEDGAVLDWTRSARSLFPNVFVATSGGWVGWPGDDGGWTLWLGSPTYTADPQEGEVIPTGHVAGFGPDGAPRWLRDNRHACRFAITTVPVLCDGDIVATSDGRGTMLPTVMEGIDTATGATTWSVELDGTIDELDGAGSVLRVADRTYVIAAPGGPVRVDVVAGPMPIPDEDAVGWCPTARVAHDAIGDDGDVHDFVRSSGSYPCRLGGEPTDAPPALPVPDFAGVSAAGWSAWVVDGEVRGARNP